MLKLTGEKIRDDHGWPVGRTRRRSRNPEMTICAKCGSPSRATSSDGQVSRCLLCLWSGTAPEPEPTPERTRPEPRTCARCGINTTPVSFGTDDFIYCRYCDEGPTVPKIQLEPLPEDDDAEITREWLESVGFEADARHMLIDHDVISLSVHHVIRDIVRTLDLLCSVQVQHWSGCVTAIQQDDDVIHIPCLTIRREMRSLCSLLGIKLKDPES